MLRVLCDMRRMLCGSLCMWMCCIVNGGEGSYHEVSSGQGGKGEREKRGSIFQRAGATMGATFASKFGLGRRRQQDYAVKVSPKNRRESRWGDAIKQLDEESRANDLHPSDDEEEEEEVRNEELRMSPKQQQSSQKQLQLHSTLNCEASAAFIARKFRLDLFETKRIVKAYGPCTGRVTIAQIGSKK